jgi:Raf kinase inhibitor-like YbhB/YbcL family protein
MPFSLTSPAFLDGQAIPVRHSAEGEGLSPPLRWFDPPEIAETFALACQDPDVPVDESVHWVVCNIPGAARELPEGMAAELQLADGTEQVRNSFHEVGYVGPAHPGAVAHRYFFRIWALDCRITLPPGSGLNELLQSMRDHILDESLLVGIYAARQESHA